MPETVWSFETENFRVELEIEPCQIDPRDCFEFAEDIEAVHSGAVDFFDASVNVFMTVGEAEALIGSDHLGACSYETVADFFEGHRDSDPMNRNCSVLRTARGNVSICHYFPDMVREAVAAARASIANVKILPMRATVVDSDALLLAN